MVSLSLLLRDDVSRNIEGHMVNLSLLLRDEVSRNIEGCRSGLFSHAAKVCAADTLRFPMAISCATETCLWLEQSRGFLLLMLLPVSINLH